MNDNNLQIKIREEQVEIPAASFNIAAAKNRMFEEAEERKAAQEGYKLLRLKDIGIFKIRKQNKIKATKLIYESVFYDTPLQYKLFTFNFGVGCPTQILFIENNLKILEGESNHFLSPKIISDGDLCIIQNPPSFEIIKKIAKILGIGLSEEGEDEEGEAKTRNKSREELWEEILAHPFKVFSLTSPLSDDTIELLKKSSNEYLQKILNFYITEGNDLDEKIQNIIKSQALNYYFETANPEHLMPYNPHAIMVTNTKSGKSTTYSKIGQKRERLSLSGALGFSTGNESNPGDLDGQFGSYALDEIQEEKNQNVIQQTLTAMETGKAVISVGKKPVYTSTIATMSFLSNPKETGEGYFEDNKKASLNAFRGILTKVTDNYRALGSRIGHVSFGNKFKAVRGNRQNAEIATGTKAIYDTIIAEIAPTFTELMLNNKVHDWLNGDLPSDYTSKIKATCKNIPIREVKEFWEGQIEAGRHIRGAAFRRACYDYVLDLWNKTYSITEIFTAAEKYLNVFLDYNLQSLEEMQEISKTYLEKYYDNVIDNCEPDYLKHAVVILLKHIELNPSCKNNYIIFDELRATFDLIENKEELFGGKYSRWNEIKAKFETIYPKVSSKLLNDFGIQDTALEGVTAFNILDNDKFDAFYKTKIYASIKLQKGGVNGVDSVNQEKNPENCSEKCPNTPVTPNTPSFSEKGEDNNFFNEMELPT